MIERIVHEGRELALIIRTSFSKDGVEFFTPGSYSQQLGYIRHPAAHVIEPHIHNPVTRAIEYTKEVLFIKSGSVRVDFYDDHKHYLESRILSTGDVILLAYGGHGFRMLEETEMIEVKQGPYVGDEDKTRFEGIAEDDVVIGDGR